MAEVKAVSRVEAIQSGDDIKPVSREEYFLKKSIGQGGGSGGAGYTVETQAVAVVPEQTAHTMKGVGKTYASGQVNLAEGITLDDIPDTLTITFQGQEYVCEANEEDGVKKYGAPMDSKTSIVDWSQYPFIVSIALDGSRNGLLTESAGDYTVKAEGMLDVVTVTDDFVKAVQKVISMTSTSGARVDSNS